MTTTLNQGAGTAGAVNTELHPALAAIAAAHIELQHEQISRTAELIDTAKTLLVMNWHSLPPIAGATLATLIAELERSQEGEPCANH